MAKKKLQRISTGIYRDAYGIRAIVDIAAGRKEKRFDFAADLKEIKRWRNETRTKLERRHPQRRAGAIGRGTFSAGVRKHLKTLAIASWKSRRSELRAWEARFGSVRRSRVTSEHVRAAIKAWVDDGVPPKTIVNRVRALTAMYHDLDGADAWTPADGVPIPKPPKKNPDYVPPERIIEVERSLRALEANEQLEPEWRGRYMVLAATGERPVFLMRAKPGDVDLERAEWSIDSAKGGNPIVLPLNSEMVAAWEVFIAANAWGTFDPSKYAHVVRAAGWPADKRPYATKHSLSQDLADRGVDLETIADWHGHTGGFRTTRIYTGFLKAKLRMASDALEGRLGWVPTNPKHLAASLGRRAATSSEKPVKLEEIREILGRLETLIKTGS